MFTTTIPYNRLWFYIYSGNVQELRVDANGYPPGHVAIENEAGVRGGGPCFPNFISPPPPLSRISIIR